MFRKMTAGAVCAAVLLMAAAHVAIADSGTFEILRGLQREYVTVDHGNEVFAGGFLRGTTTVTASSGGPFAAGEPSVTECLVFTRRAGESFALEAPCVHEDTTGDVYYLTAIRKQGTVETGGGGPGRWELRGGTGKYQGVTGSCSYRTRYLVDGWLVSIGSCEWSRP